ncbi:MAG: acylneuraminate cytidylyltransferase [Bdellovibrionota bacterium]
MRTIAFVPVRGGSQSIPLKNIKLLAGKPLVYWLLLACERCADVDQIVIATDSSEIEKIVLSFGFKKLVVYRRLPANATNKASTESVLLEYLEVSKEKGDTRIILAQATNPFTTAKDLSEALKLLLKKKADSLLSVCRNKRFLWSKSGRPINYDYTQRPRRQDFAGCFVENGAFYINSAQNIIKNNNRLSGKIEIFEMTEDSYFEIDEPSDWVIVEELFKRHLRNTGQCLLAGTLKLFLSDVDGVLTDGSMYYSEKGDELKRFSTYDGVALRLLHEHGIQTGLITSENSELVKRRAKKLKVDHLYMGVENKLEVVQELCEKLKINISQVAYVGDDMNCYDLLCAVGFKACPDNAIDTIKSIPGILQLERRGGMGVLREFYSHLLSTAK